VVINFCQITRGEITYFAFAFLRQSIFFSFAETILENLRDCLLNYDDICIYPHWSFPSCFLPTLGMSLGGKSCHSFCRQFDNFDYFLFQDKNRALFPILRQREVCVSDSFTVQMSKVGAHPRQTPRDRRPSTAACPACWAIWTKVLKFSRRR
jgi:hypothetical protein